MTDATTVKRIEADMRKNPKKYRLIFEAYRKLPDKKREFIRKIPKTQRKKLRKLS